MVNDTASNRTTNSIILNVQILAFLRVCVNTIGICYSKNVSNMMMCYHIRKNSDDVVLIVEL